MKEENVFEAHDSYVLSLRFTRDSQRLVSAGMDNVVKIWSVDGWRQVGAFEGHANSVNSISLSPDERVLATGSSDNTVRLWSFPAGELLHTLQDRKKVVSAVQISPDGAWVAAASYGGRVMIWTLSGEEVVGFKVSDKNLSSVAFSPQGDALAAAGLGDDISIWSLPSAERIATLTGHKTAVGSLSYIQGGRYLVSLGYEQQVKFWDTLTGQETRSVRAKDAGVRGMVISSDGGTAALSMESKVELWSVADWTLLAELPVGTKSISSMAFAPDGHHLAIGAADRKIRIWEWHKG